MMWRRIVSSHLKTLAASAASPRRSIICNPVLSPISTISTCPSDFLGHFRSESEGRFSSYEHIKTLATADFAAAASPRRFVACKPVGLLAANHSATSTSSSLLSRRFSSESETPGKKNAVEDVMPTETQNERVQHEEPCLSSGECSNDGSIGDTVVGVLLAALVIYWSVMLMYLPIKFLVMGLGMTQGMMLATLGGFWWSMVSIIRQPFMALVALFTDKEK